MSYDCTSLFTFFVWLSVKQTAHKTCHVFTPSVTSRCWLSQAETQHNVPQPICNCPPLTCSVNTSARPRCSNFHGITLQVATMDGWFLHCFLTGSDTTCLTLLHWHVGTALLVLKLCSCLWAMTALYLLEKRCCSASDLSLCLVTWPAPNWEVVIELSHWSRTPGLLEAICRLQCW